MNHDLTGSASKANENKWKVLIDIFKNEGFRNSVLGCRSPTANTVDSRSVPLFALVYRYFN